MRIKDTYQQNIYINFLSIINIKLSYVEVANETKWEELEMTDYIEKKIRIIMQNRMKIGSHHG